MLQAVRENRDMGAAKLKNITKKSFNEGQLVRIYDHIKKKYDQLGNIVNAHCSSIWGWKSSDFLCPTRKWAPSMRALLLSEREPCQSK